MAKGLTQLLKGKKSSFDSESSSYRRLGRFYRVPRPRQLWNEVQEEIHIGWAETFFDLIYVGVAFAEGKLIAQSFKDGDFATGFYVFLVTFTLLFDNWRSRLQYSARFAAKDIAHKIFDIIGMLLVAAAVLHLDLLDVFLDLDSMHMFGFALCMALISLRELLLASELFLLGQTPPAHGTGAQMFRMEIHSFILHIAATFCAWPGNGFSWQPTVHIWLAAIAFKRFDLYLRIYHRKHLPTWYAGVWGVNNSVPMNINHTIHRYSEWTMLMLGEGVLQIIIVPLESTVDFYATFCLGYVIMALLGLLHYSTEPNHANGHCMRRSGKRVFFWILFETLYSASLTCAGVGLKLVLSYSHDSYKVFKYSKLLSGSVAGAILMLWASRLCHAGISDEFYNAETAVDDNGVEKTTYKLIKLKVLLWLIKMVIPGILVGLSFVQMKSWVLVLVNGVIILLAFLVQLKDSRKFGDSIRLRGRHRRKHNDEKEEEDQEEDLESRASVGTGSRSSNVIDVDTSDESVSSYEEEETQCWDGFGVSKETWGKSTRSCILRNRFHHLHEMKKWEKRLRKLEECEKKCPNNKECKGKSMYEKMECLDQIEDSSEDLPVPLQRVQSSHV